MGMLHGTRRALWGGGGYVYPFSLNDVTFTPGMAKRTGEAGVFDAAPIVQGHYDLSGTPDALGHVRGDLLGNALDHFYANFDPYQGTMIQWFTPEISSAALTSGYTYLWYISANYYARYAYNVNRFEYVCGGVTVNRVAAIVAGTTYHLTCSWNVNNSLDGTNYIRDGLNDVYAYGGTGLAASAPDATMYFGRNAILEGTFYIRRVLYDGTYGTPPVDGADELAAIYAAGAGLDPARVIGSWDTVFCCPTDSTPGALVTGTGEAWSQPHADSLPDVSFMSDGGLPGTPFAVEFDGTSTLVGCGSGATLDDIPLSGHLLISLWVRVDVVSGEMILLNKTTWGSAGWELEITGSGYVYMRLDRTGADSVATWDLEDLEDGKLHHIVGYYNHAAATCRIAVDGRWDAVGAAGTGNYVSDAALNLVAGRRSDAGSFYLNGAIAWWEIWDNQHFVPGTDFIPPRAPTAAGPGNLIETWWADEGTGATVAARVTTPANDGTITSGSWSALWEQDGTPVIPQSFLLDGAATIINGGSGATIDDLPDFAVAGKGPISVDVWVRIDAVPTAARSYILNKGIGWYMSINVAGTLDFLVHCATTDSDADWAFDVEWLGKWIHLLGTYDETGDRRARLWVNGILVATGGISAGNYVSDAAANLIAAGTGGSRLNGALGIIRISDSVRQAATFVPFARSNPPGVDGNTMLQWDMNDGAGTTATDTSGNANHGTITMGAGRWLNTPDMETESPGERVYPWGYAIGSDGADDGITIIENQEVTAGVSYVVRASLSVGMSGRAQPYIEVYDNIGAAQIGADFPYPFMTGVHDGAGGAATLQDSTARWVYNFVGWSLYNITDGSSTTVTANTEITQTGVLAGGGSNDWQIGETYLLRPPSNRSYSQHPWQETFVITAPAGCTSIDVKVLNAAGEGITHIHQVEVYASRMTNGDYEAGAGVPWVPTGWTATYVAGEGVQELVTIHSGASAVEIVSTAGVRFLYRAPTATTNGRFYVYGCWLTGNGTDGINQVDANGPVLVRHSDGGHVEGGLIAVAWNELLTVRRKDAGVTLPGLGMPLSAAGSRFADDLYIFELDDVSLTVTPASYANSLESGGVRVDGLDSATVPATAHRMRARSGGIKFRVRPRHSLANAQALGQTHEYLLDLTEDGNNYLRLYRTTNTLTLAVNQQGAGAATDTDATAWAADTEVKIEVLNLGSRIRVRRDGVTVCELTGLAGFATDFTAAAYFGSDDAPDLELDGVIAAP